MVSGPGCWAGSRQQNLSMRKMSALRSEMAGQGEREQHPGTCEWEEGASGNVTEKWDLIWSQRAGVWLKP